MSTATRRLCSRNVISQAYFSLIALFVVLMPHSVFASDSAQQEGYIVFEHYDGSPSVLTIPKGEKVTLEVELGEWSENSYFISDKYQLSTRDILIEQQNERCLTINDEGPHFDFYEWKVQRSAWKNLSLTRTNTWKSVQFEALDFLEPPQVSKDELLRRVAKILGNGSEGVEGWQALASECLESTDRCRSLCRIKLRISQRTSSGEVPLKVIEILVPMGC